MHDEPINELPVSEEDPLDAGDAGLWPVGGFGDVEPEPSEERRPIGVWGSVDANGQRLFHQHLFASDFRPDEHGEVFPSGLRWKHSKFRRGLTLDSALSFTAVFLFGIAAGLTLAAYLDSRLPK